MEEGVLVEPHLALRVLPAEDAAALAAVVTAIEEAEGRLARRRGADVGGAIGLEERVSLRVQQKRPRTRGRRRREDGEGGDRVCVTRYATLHPAQASVGDHATVGPGERPCEAASLARKTRQRSVISAALPRHAPLALVPALLKFRPRPVELGALKRDVTAIGDIRCTRPG
jgi:hypothetical protein